MDRRTLTDFLTAEFGGCTVSGLEALPGGDRMAGTLLWAGFEGLSQIDRQNRLWDALREHFDAAELQSISFLITFTPDEVEAITSD